MHIIVLQVIFAAAIIGFFAYAFGVVYQKMAASLIQGIAAAVLSEGTFTAAEVIAETSDLRDAYFTTVIASAVLITTIFGYVIARVALSPARTALASQKRFISDIAHELRTPIAIIKTNNEVALLNESLDGATRTSLESSVEELDRASDIINNLLTFSSWSSPERINFETLDLTAIAGGAVEKLRDLAVRREVSVALVGAETVLAVGNRTALDQVTTNLIKNAISYTPVGGQVTVSVATDSRHYARLSVADTGMGIAEADLAHIFEPFYRAERSRSRESGSSGLGLAIVAELVKIHQGKITVRSVLERGTTVTVLIPQDGALAASGTLESEQRDPSEVSLDFIKKYF